MKSILILIFSLIPLSSPAPGFEELYIAKSEGLRDQRLLKAIIQVESKGNPNAINFKEQAMGLLQIRPVMLKEANRIAGYEKYRVHDCFDSAKSIEIFWLVQNHHNPTGDYYRGSKVWNGYGKTNKYWRKIQKEL